MKTKIIIVISTFVLSATTVFALSNDFNFDTSKLSFTENSKKDNVVSNFNKKYDLTYSISNIDQKLEEEIKTLTKKTTYLLFGGFNNTEETSEEYYKRHKEWLDLRYDPKIPKDDNNKFGLDTDSQEYADNLISELAIPQIFNQVNEMGLIYNSFGDIRVTKNDNIVISSIILPNVKIKEQSKSDPMKYDYLETNYVMYYYYKKLNNKWKLYYLYGESTDEVSSYFNEIESSTSNEKMAIAPSYESKIETVYNFEKLKNMTQEELNNIYNLNINNIVYLNSYYNNAITASANGFFISNGLVVTTWSFIEKSLIDAQYITINNKLNTFEFEGIVTANLEADVAIIKVKDYSSQFVKIGNSQSLKVEDPVITISSKNGVDAIVQKGIVVSNDDYIQTSIPLLTVDEGSPLFNQKGEVIGFNTSKITNASISVAVTSNILKEIQNKFSNLDFNSIESIPFSELKEKYYYVKYNQESTINNIPKNKQKEYLGIGNIEETIKLKLIKSSYKNGIVSLRYKNDIAKYLNSMQLASDFKQKLIKDGYKQVMNTNSKSIYKNKKYQIIIMDEFDYLIVVMVKL